jgi:hypothetical protein
MEYGNCLLGRVGNTAGASSSHLSPTHPDRCGPYGDCGTNLFPAHAYGRRSICDATTAITVTLKPIAVLAHRQHNPGGCTMLHRGICMIVLVLAITFAATAFRPAGQAYGAANADGSQERPHLLSPFMQQPPMQPPTPTGPMKFVSATLNSGQPGRTSLNNEPSAIAFNLDGAKRFEVWNTYSARYPSQNGMGDDWDFLDPVSCCGFESLSHYGGFAGDQGVYYRADYDLIFWLLLYDGDEGSITSAVRLAWARASTLSNGVTFCTHDFTVVPPYEADYPKMGFTDHYAWLFYALRNSTDTTGGIVAKIDLAALNTTPCYMANPVSVGTIGRRHEFIERGSDTMYFAAAVDHYITIKVYRWREADSSPTYVDLHVLPYNGARFTYRCKTGDANWCWNSDDTILGGWRRFVSSDELGPYEQIGFYWNAGQDPPYHSDPYVRFLLINAADMSIVSQPNLAWPGIAYQYASLSTNDRGDLGGTVMWSGDEAPFENCAVITRDRYTSPDAFLGLYYPYYSYFDTSSPLGGDYLAARPHPHIEPITGLRLTWTSTCYQLLVSGNPDDVRSNFIHFWRPGDY